MTVKELVRLLKACDQEADVFLSRDEEGNGFEVGVSDGRPIFVSDNPAYDWQWINFYFWRYFGANPFGHSARRIGDFYAGLVGDFYQANHWKKWRQTPHDHNPVNDAMGNVEAFEKMLEFWSTP